MSSITRPILIFFCPAVLLVASGCLDPLRAAPLVDDVRAVAVIYDNAPWLSFDPAGDLNPEGLKLNVYLMDAKTSQAVFGNGNIVVDMYTLEAQGKGQPTRVPAKQWRYGPHDAPRGNKATAVGWGYGLRLDWRPAQVLGKEIELVVSFERRDGQVIRSRTIRFHVPRPLQGSSPAPAMPPAADVAREPDRPVETAAPRRR